MTTDVTVTGTGDRLGETVAVDVAHVDVTYTVRGHDRLTVRDISFQIGQHESFGLVGESGCGKTTMALAHPLPGPEREGEPGVDQRERPGSRVAQP